MVNKTVGTAEPKYHEGSELPVNKGKEFFSQQMRTTIAKKFSNNIWGAGFIFNSSNENIKKEFKKLDRNNDLLDFFAYVERTLSLEGRVVVVLDKFKNGDINFNIVNPKFFNGVGKIIITPILAVIYQRVIIGQANYIVKSTYDDKKVIHDLFGVDDQIIIYDKIQKLGELGLEPIWFHNLGFVPVIEITNLPNRQLQFNNMEFIQLADWYPAQQYERVMFDTYINLQKEIWYCHSRMAVENGSQEFIQKLKTSRKATNGTNDYDDVANMFDDILIDTETGAKVSALPGQGDFTKYTQTMNEIMDLYYKFAGASRFGEGGGAQKSVAETSLGRAGMLETINQKINSRERTYTMLLRKLFCAKGLMNWDDEEDDFNFKIVGNIIEDPTTTKDNFIKDIQIGAMRIVDYIAIEYKLDEVSAMKKYEEIRDFNEKEDIMTTLSIGGGANLDIPDDEEGGRPDKKPDSGEDNDK